MSTVCSHCGGTDIEYDAARGDAVCTGCGSVLEDNIIVSEVSFQEQSSGASTVIGQFVSSEGGKVPLSGTGFHHGMGKDSREITLQHAKKRLSNLGNMLKLNQHCIDMAYTFFKMALDKNLTRGRKSSIIDTACLYLVCRSEGTPHLLLDFSDVLQINVYALGRAYLKLSNALHINPPAIDPCLYIHRFAHKLELGEKTHEVSMTALRLVARMKRDWIHHGRRPAGLCGASLLVASRMHNFSRSVKEVARVVKLSEGTIRKRLGDFRDTASSRLTIDEFLKIDLEQEHDPPSFTEAKKKGKHQQAQSEELDDSDDDDERVSGGVVAEELGSIDKGEAEDQDGGFGGIVMSSVEDTIAKARIAEAFMNGVPAAGLSPDLEDLAKLVEEEDKKVEVEDANVNEPEEQQAVFEDIDDEEIERMLLSEEEVKIKTQLWFAENADFLREQEARRERLAKEKANQKEKPKNKRRRKKIKHEAPASTAGEAIERMLVEKRISSKINYDVLRGLDLGTEGETVGVVNSLKAELPSYGTGLSDLSATSILDSALLSYDSATYQAGSRGFGSSTASISGTSSLLSTDQLPSSVAPLAIARTPTESGGRLPSLSTRKRTFSSLSGGSLYGPSSKLSRLQPSLQYETQATPSISKSDCKSEPMTTPVLSNRPEAAVQNTTVTHTSSERQPVCESGEHIGGGVEVKGEGVTGGGGGCEVVEESGPVQYCEEEEEEEEGGFRDEEMDELAYEGDPLLQSDYEDAGEDFYGDHGHEDY